MMKVDLEAEKAILSEIHAKTRVSKSTNIEEEMNYIYDETFFIPPTGKPIVGNDAIRNMFLETMKTSSQSMGDPKRGHTDFWMSASGDLAVNRGHFKVMKNESNETTLDEGYYITVYRKVNGKWKLLGEMWNSIR
jgi:ketosteroid isomerase-like protein